VEEMRYYTFYRESNNFDDILKDPILKKSIDEVISWYQYLIIGLHETEKNNQNSSYITLKYGDEMQNDLIKDRSPIPGVDYVPKKDLARYKKVIE
jgi:hypothetical protein